MQKPKQILTWKNFIQQEKELKYEVRGIHLDWITICVRDQGMVDGEGTETTFGARAVGDWVGCGAAIGNKHLRPKVLSKYDLDECVSIGIACQIAQLDITGKRPRQELFHDFGEFNVVSNDGVKSVVSGSGVARSAAINSAVSGYGLEHVLKRYGQSDTEILRSMGRFNHSGLVRIGEFLLDMKDIVLKTNGEVTLEIEEDFMGAIISTPSGQYRMSQG